MKKKARLIAFFLPQYHPVPENDQWHGKGFTEWTNVTKARPMFRKHYQPILPADLGYYDLRVPETRIAQAEMAKAYGIEAFCYWHYWFGNGKRILERPFNEVLNSGEPDFPFCLGWANSSWTGIWYGMSDNVLLEQTYPGEDDFIAHFYAMLPAFKDKRYVTVNGRRLFFIFVPRDIRPSPAAFAGIWQNLAKKEGIEGFHFIGTTFTHEPPLTDGFAGSVQFAPFECLPRNKFLSFVQEKLKIDLSEIRSGIFKRPRVNPYKDLVDYLASRQLFENEYPLLMPNWDNTARCGTKGSVLQDASPELFKKMVENSLKKIDHINEFENRLIFIKSWNEWAEGNYLEPDRIHGRKYLDVIRECVTSSDDDF